MELGGKTMKKWRLTTEEPPEKSMNVWVTYMKDGERKVMATKYLAQIKKFLFFDKIEDVIAWMPSEKPEPYGIHEQGIYEQGIHGYKVFDPDWCCRPAVSVEKQYSCPGKFEEETELDLCNKGMHFCKNIVDCFSYKRFDSDNKVAEVIAYGKIVENGNKCCTDKLEIVRELSWEEVLEKVNTGKGCTGIGNSGNHNSGDCNSGNRNSGNYNSGNRNSGYCNSGDCNSGNRNSGNCNSGDWNTTNYSSGCFNTIEEKIRMFNKPSKWTYNDWLKSDAYFIMKKLNCGIAWISEKEMTEEEKKNHPEYKTIGGYLRECNTDEPQKKWDCLSEDNKKEIMSLPNFDEKIFYEITGIRAREGEK